MYNLNLVGCFMIKNEYLEAVYEKLISSHQLTTKELLEIGFTNRDITRLKEKGLLVSVERGLYSFSYSSEGIDLLIGYLNKLVEDGNHRKVRQLLYNNFDVTNIPVYKVFDFFKLAIDAHSYRTMYQCIEIMSNFDYNKDSLNTWLFLMNYLSDVPEEFAYVVKNLKFEDIKPSNDFYDVKYLEFITRVRMAIFSGDFNQAHDLYTSFEGELTFLDKITLKLINRVVYQTNCERNLYDDLVDDENYEALIKILIAADKTRPLGLYEKILKTLVEDYMMMLDKGVIPITKTLTRVDFDMAIGKKRYAIAREIYASNLLRKKEDRDSSIPYSKCISTMLDRLVEKEEMLKLVNNAKKIGDENFSLFVACLMDKNIDGAFAFLDEYLSNINRISHRNYIASLIKLSLVDGDKTFMEPVLALSRMRDERYQFDVTPYIQDFFYSLANGSLDRAKIYLDIISESEKLGGVAINVDDLRESLTNKMRVLGIEENDLKLGEIDAKKDINIGQIREEKLKVETGESLDRKTDNLLPLVDVLDEVIKGDNLALLAPLSEEDTERVLKIVEKVSYIDAFIVSDPVDNSSHIALKYSGKLFEYVDKRKTLAAGDNAYRDRRYKDAIDCYESVLPLLHNPSASLYYKLGYSYYKTADGVDFSDAIDYIILASFNTMSNCNYERNKDLLRDLKIRSGYNGKIIDIDAPGTKTYSKMGKYIKK